MKTPQPENLQFSYEWMEPSQRPTDYPHVNPPEWIHKDTLKVSVIIPANHGAVRWCGDYGLTNQVLTLKYKSLLNEFLAAGWKPVKLTYVIYNMPRTQFTEIEVKETESVIRGH